MKDISVKQNQIITQNRLKMLHVNDVALCQGK